MSNSTYGNMHVVKWSVIAPILACIMSLARDLPAHAGLVLTGGGLKLIEQGGSFAPNNLSISGSATPTAVDELGFVPGFADHVIEKLNDGVYGNPSSWIGDGGTNAHGVAFAGISLGAIPVPLINSIAFGRDNTGVFTDRTLMAVYTLQYTQVPDPHTDIDLPDDTTVLGTTAATGWVTVGTLDYQSPGGVDFSQPSLRHRYTFDPVNATGVRLIVPLTSQGGGPIGGTRPAIDEIELYAVPEPTAGCLLLIAITVLVPAWRRR